MKKFMKWYMKATVVMYIVYPLVAWIGDWIISRHPLKDEENQNYAKFMFATMKYCCLSPYYTVKWIFGKKEKIEKAAE